MREDNYNEQNYIFLKQGTVLCFYLEYIVSRYSWVHLYRVIKGRRVGKKELDKSEY